MKSRTWYLVGGLFALLVAVSVVVVLRGSKGRLDELIEAARARGEPGTVADLLDASPTTSSPGVLRLIELHEVREEQGIELVTADPATEETATEEFLDADDVSLAAARVAVRQHSEHVEALEAALREEQPRFAISATPGGDVDTAHIFPLIEATRWVHVAAEVRHREHPQTTTLLDTGELLLRYAETIPGRSLIEALTAVSVRSRGLAALRTAVADGRSIEPERLARLDALLARASTSNPRAALAAERAFAIDTALAISGDPRATVGGSVVPQAGGGALAVFWRGDVIDYVEDLDAAAELLADDPVAAIESFQEHEEELEGWRRRVRPLSATLMPVNSKLVPQLLASDAGARLARVALAVQAHRRSTGRWPKSAEEAVGDTADVLLDHPFDATRRLVVTPLDGGGDAVRVQWLGGEPTPWDQRPAPPDARWDLLPTAR